MANARQCDVCGEFYEAYNTKKDPKNPSGIMLVNVDCNGKYWENKVIDCCPKCMSEIMSVLNKSKEKK